MNKNNKSECEPGTEPKGSNGALKALQVIEEGETIKTRGCITVSDRV